VEKNREKEEIQRVGEKKNSKGRREGKEEDRR